MGRRTVTDRLDLEPAPDAPRLAARGRHRQPGRLVEERHSSTPATAPTSCATSGRSRRSNESFASSMSAPTVAASSRSGPWPWASATCSHVRPPSRSATSSTASWSGRGPSRHRTSSTRTAGAARPGRKSGLAEDPSRFAGIREYTPGDPIKRIHPRASARLGRPSTKRFEPSRDREVLIALDIQTTAGPVGTSTTTATRWRRCMSWRLRSADTAGRRCRRGPGRRGLHRGRVTLRPATGLGVARAGRANAGPAGSPVDRTRRPHSSAC